MPHQSSSAAPGAADGITGPEAVNTTERPLTRWEETDNTHGYGSYFAELLAAGTDVYGEARLADVLSPRKATILDAGCGMGRIGGALHHMGHTVVGVDLDAGLLAQATETYPDLPTVQSRLDDLTPALLTEHGHPTQFDTITVVGNVMILLAPDTEVLVLHRLRDLLAPEGRILVGFHTDATPPNSLQYSPEVFAEHVAQVGLHIESRFGTYDLRPYQPTDNYVVHILTRRTELTLTPAG